MTDTARTAAHRQAIRFAIALEEGFRGLSSAAVYDINGTIYVVTSGTGEGQDYAYEVPGSESLDTLEHAIATHEWSYSSWCSTGGIEGSPDYTTDRNDAVAYYMATSRPLGDGGSPILTVEEMTILDLAIANVDCCHEMGGIS